MNLRQKIQACCDRAIAALIALVVLGSVLCFGGAVWWFRPFLVATTFLLVMAGLARHLAAGRMPLLKSPLTFFGLLALGLGVLQLAPLPARLAQRLSPSAHEIYARGMYAAGAHADDPEAALPEAPEIRSPASLDRSATLRWLVVAAACLGIFWAVSHYADRLERLYLVWGLVVAGFLLNAALAIVQITNRSDGLYGLFVPGAGPAFTPTLNDLLEAPGTAALRDLPAPGPAAPGLAGPVPGAVLTPTAPFLFGTMMASPGAFLACGTLALPLAIGIVLHLVSPRGSRERLSDRLGQSGQGSLVLLLVVLMAIGAFLIGLVAGPWYGLPLVAGVAAVGLPALFSPGARWPAFGLATLVLAGLGLGVAMEAAWPVLLKGPCPVRRPDPETAQSLWSEGLEVLREFPLVGSGLGTFPSIHPYFKDRDTTSTTAMSSLVQWGVEAGAAGLGLLALAALWCLARLPGGLKRVGSIDRSLAFGLIGAVLGFSLLAVVHWTVELSAVAVSASALGGTWNRWLAGGTDLFVERG